MFYSSTKILSYNKIFNFAIGNRTGGKTFNAKDLAIRGYKNKGAIKVWVRRELSEMDKTFRDKFFNDIQFKYPIYY